jgi:CubicO group peptidase (beta-lactamase class C family)
MSRRAFDVARRLSLLARSVAVLGLLLAGVTHADQIDSYIETQLQRQHIPGLSLAIVRDGRVEKLQAYGFADLELKVPATPDTVFEIGSISKQFLSAALMTLVEQRKIGLTDPAARYLPDLPPAWREVTIRQLLTHTSGIPDFEEILGYGAYRNPTTGEQVLAAAAGKPMDFPPGTQWHYSNTGYYLLGLIVEKITGEPHVAFVQQRILGPAGMTRTRSSEPNEVIPGRASGYYFESGRFENRDPIQPTAVGAAGDLVSTIGDLIKWNATLDAQSILGKDSYAQIWADQPLTDGSRSGYGFGWEVLPMHDHRAQSHSGGTAGFSSNILRLPDDHVAVIVLTNTGRANPVSITNHVARLLVPGLRYKAVPDPDPEVAERVMDFFAHRLDADVYEKPLSAEFAAQIRPYWSSNQDYYRALGPPREIERVEREAADATRTYRYRVRYADTTRIVTVTTDSNGRISNLAPQDE